MSDETAAAIPDELWGLRWKGKESQWLSEGDWDIAACVSREATQSDAFWSKPQHRDLWEPVLIGVSPAIRDERDALRAENEKLRSAAINMARAAGNESEKCDHWIAEHIRLADRIAELEAELATLRGEGPLRVGDVVQMLSPDGMRCMFIVEPSNIAPGGFIQQSLHLGAQIHRIGRAVRMPDGTPVDQ